MPKRSPFPGLDPYLEAHWGDVHHSLIQYTRDALQDSLPEDLLARVEERVYVEDGDARVRSIAPDARIVEWRQSNGPALEAETEAGGVAVAEPRVVVIEDEEITEGYLEIREADGGRVVTVIEFLSPTNKAGSEGTEQYLRKQNQVLRSNASLVELDFVRSGRHVLCVAERRFPPEWRNCARACISRSWKRHAREIYGFPLRERLRALPIPLREHEKPVLLDLQALLDQCYRMGRYDRIDYSEPPFPPLNAEDAAWAREVIAASARAGSSE